jgi:hypothetical protein
MEHGLVAGIHPAGSGERLPGAGGDRLHPPGPGRPGPVPDADRRRALQGFLREAGEVYATGPTLERLVEVAGRHGVRPAFDLPGP